MSLQFQRRGRSWHPVIETAADLEALLTLDEALWVATAAPIDTLVGDPAFLASLDPDGDGRIRSDDVRDAIRWTLGVLRDRAGVGGDAACLTCEAIDPDHADGAGLLGSIREIHDRVLPEAREVVTLDQIRRIKKEEMDRGLHSAGKVLPTAAEGEVGALLAHVIEVTGGEPHPADGVAVTEAGLARFVEEATAWLAWHDRGALDRADVRPLGAATESGSDRLEGLHPKLEQYFLLCDALRLDPALTDAAWISASPSELLDPAEAAALLARAPLARPRADGLLDLRDGLNPAYHTEITRLRTEVVAPLLGHEGPLDRAGWEALQARLAGWREWVAARPATKVGDRPPDQIRRHATSEALHEAVRELLAETEVREKVFSGVSLVEKLCLYQALLISFCNNFAGHRDLYDLDIHAHYEMGTLILDGRRFNLAVRVPDPERHEKFCNAASMYVLYVQVGEHTGKWELEVAVPVTAGDRGNLREGIYGVFKDREGLEKHAYVRKVISNPISLREAIWAPLGDIVAGIESLFDKARDLQRAVVATAVVPKTAPTLLKGPAPAAPAAPAGNAPATANVVALVAGAGLVLAAISAALAGVVATFQSTVTALSGGLDRIAERALVNDTTIAALSPVLFLIAVLATILAFFAVPLLAYLIPVVISAWLKLRRRDLAVLLEGGGWAINHRMFIDRRTARLFTQEPRVPKAQRSNR